MQTITRQQFTEAIEKGIADAASVEPLDAEAVAALRTVGRSSTQTRIAGFGGGDAPQPEFQCPWTAAGLSRGINADWSFIFGFDAYFDDILKSSDWRGTPVGIEG